MKKNYVTKGLAFGMVLVLSLLSACSNGAEKKRHYRARKKQKQLQRQRLKEKQRQQRRQPERRK